MNKVDINKFRRMRDGVATAWYKGDYADRYEENFCTLGHIAVALGQLDGDFDNVVEEGMPYAMVIQDVIDEQYPEWARASNTFRESLTIPDWNDEEGRTVDEVVAVFEKAIVKAEEL